MAINYVYMTTKGALALLNLKRVALNAAGYQLGLFTNVPALTPGMLLSALVECTFPGYARQAMTNFGAAATNASPPNADSLDVVHTFLCTGAGSADTYQGWFVVDGSGNLLMLGFSNTGTPIAFDANGKFATVQPRITEAAYTAYP